MTREISLSVNDNAITLEYFVRGFIDHTVTGMIAALKNTQEIETLEIVITGDNVAIKLNSAQVPLNYFANEIIGRTIKSMVSPLKGVSEINNLKLNIVR